MENMLSLLSSLAWTAELPRLVLKDILEGNLEGWGIRILLLYGAGVLLNGVFNFIRRYKMPAPPRYM